MNAPTAPSALPRPATRLRVSDSVCVRCTILNTGTDMPMATTLHSDAKSPFLSFSRHPAPPATQSPHIVLCRAFSERQDVSSNFVCTPSLQPISAREFVCGWRCLHCTDNKASC